MESARGVVKHIVLAKFKDDIPPDQIDQLIKQYANLVNLVEPMKAFHWNMEVIFCLASGGKASGFMIGKLEAKKEIARGKDVSIENLHQGFTHVFESTFDSTRGVAEYIAHPAHVEYANTLLPLLEKVLIIDYKPEKVSP